MWYQAATQRTSTSQNRARGDCRWCPHMSHLQAGLLREQVGPPTHGSYFYRWHGAADIQVFIRGTACFHQSNTVRTTYILCCILKKKKESKNIKLLFLQNSKRQERWRLEPSPVHRQCRWQLRCLLRGHCSRRCSQPWQSPPGFY